MSRSTPSIRRRRVDRVPHAGERSPLRPSLDPERAVGDRSASGVHAALTSAPLVVRSDVAEPRREQRATCPDRRERRAHRGIVSRRRQRIPYISRTGAGSVPNASRDTPPRIGRHSASRGGSRNSSYTRRAALGHERARRGRGSRPASAAAPGTSAGCSLVGSASSRRRASAPRGTAVARRRRADRPSAARTAARTRRDTRARRGGAADPARRTACPVTGSIPWIRAWTSLILAGRRVGLGLRPEGDGVGQHQRPLQALSTGSGRTSRSGSHRRRPAGAQPAAARLAHRRTAR